MRAFGLAVRSRASRILVVLATIALVGAILAGYVDRAAFDADQLANRATAALRDESVRGLVAERITDDVVLSAQADLVAARPAIQSAAEAIVGTDAFTGLFRAGVRDLHRALIGGDQDTVTLALADVGTLLRGALRAFDPEISTEVDRRTGRVELLTRDIGDFTSGLTRTAEKIQALAIVLFVLTAVLFAAAVIVSDDRRRTIGEAGAWVAGAGVLIVLAFGVLRAVAINGVDEPTGRDAAGAVWDAFLGDLRTAGWILAGSGAVVAAAAASVLRPIDVEARVSRVWQTIVREPERPLLRVVRAVGLILTGVLMLTQGEAILRLALTVAAVYVVYKGAEALLRMVVRPEETPRPTRERRNTAARIRRAAVTGLTILAIATATGLFVGLGGTSEATPEIRACNGHRELCERHLEDVVFAATHNSMTVPLPGWFSVQQDAPIAEQLNDGVRGLLIDTHYGVRLPDGKVKTDLEDESSVQRSKFVDGLGPKAVDAALRLRDRLGFAGEGERGLYLCHSFCELGYTPLAAVLDDVHDFLVANPHEVLVMVNQDDISPADFVKAFDDAGLTELTYRGPTTAPFPTLREMIEQDQRVVVMAENQAGQAPWYHSAYDSITQETPFQFKSAEQLTDPELLERSCEANRGTAGAPLFLINHWVATDPAPLPSNATKVNAHDALLRRATHCRRQRERVPNLLAVDFYRRGDLFSVVDELNGVAH